MKVMTFLRQIVLTGLTTAMMLVSALAVAMTDEQYEQMMTAYNQGSFESIKKIIEPLAKQGDVDAQILFGDMYLNGKGVTKDVKQARYWFEKAAAQGDDEAKEALKQLDKEGK